MDALPAAETAPGFDITSMTGTLHGGMQSAVQDGECHLLLEPDHAHAYCGEPLRASTVTRGSGEAEITCARCCRLALKKMLRMVIIR